MASVSRTRIKSKVVDLPPLENGDHLDQPTFHKRYLAMGGRVQAELIGGVVFMAAAENVRHCRSEPLVARWLDEYAEATPGTDVLANVTSILGEDSEPQPDLCLIVDAACGGQTTVNKEDFLVGPPELAVELSYTSESIDLHAKLEDYQRAGIREYLVVALRRNEVFWFERKRGRFQQFAPGQDGILRSSVFPGLWLDPAALLGRDRTTLLSVLREGLGSAPHQAFVAKLAKKKR